MKKFIGLFALVAAFTFLAASTTTAQIVFNSTSCSFRVVIEYGDVASCTSLGSVDIIANPGTTPLPIPPGMGVLASKGYYVPTTSLTPCVYYISSVTCPYPYGPVDNVSCTSGCGNYVAELVFGGSVIFLHN